jgi:predicted RNA-binding Zn-ribbon protein involved in translation (DUF1610 family)
MEQLTRCNDCGDEFLAWAEDGEFSGDEFTCPACGSEDTTCI